MNPSLFFTFTLFTAITLLGIITPYPYNLFPVIFVFILIPIIDAIIGVNKTNPTQEQEQNWKTKKFWAPPLYLYVLTHFLILGFAIHQVHTHTDTDVIILGVIIGLHNGGLGITVAHELCHKNDQFHQRMADLVLTSVWYQHFAIEHVRGHHFAVATVDDPASARRNESVYPFLLRTIFGSYIHAFKIDPKKVLLGSLVSTIFTLAAFEFGGMKVGVFFITQAIIAIILLELVNYVEHYGLSRKKLENGRYEKVLPIHSWNSAHLFSNLILFNLQRHSDHHASAHLHYTTLKHQESAPQLPTGYPGMILIALLPPLWFRMMNPKVDRIH
jgi:alkane 1-monooxygenase